MITVILAAALIDSKINQLFLKPRHVLNILAILWGHLSLMHEAVASEVGSGLDFCWDIHSDMISQTASAVGH